MNYIQAKSVQTGFSESFVARIPNVLKLFQDLPLRNAAASIRMNYTRPTSRFGHMLHRSIAIYNGNRTKRLEISKGGC
jgi:hypothetical protein